ncbi:helix-turn-helix domain-containing protein [bacterium]|nr:helix-turn-helix domain-containing protein [bacterium]
MPKITSNEGKPFAEIGLLIRNLRLRHGFSQYDLARVSGINNSYLSRIENGERRPSPKILKRFAEILQYPYDKLVVISGILSAEFVESTPATIPPPPVPQEGTRFAGVQGQVGFGTYSHTSVKRRGVPVFDTVPAGLLKDANVVEAHDDVMQIVLTEEELAFDPRAFALIVKGDSMVEAGILDGDIVVVSPGTEVGSGEIGVVLVNKTTTSIKKIYVDGERVVLQPANSNYPPLILTYPDEVEILGKVVLVRRKMM